MLYLFESHFVPLLFLSHKCPTPSARERNRVFSAASERAGRCQINSTVLGKRPGRTVVEPGVGTSGPSPSRRKGKVGAGREGWRTCPPRGAGIR